MKAKATFLGSLVRHRENHSAKSREGASGVDDGAIGGGEDDEGVGPILGCWAGSHTPSSRMLPGRFEA